MTLGTDTQCVALQHIMVQEGGESASSPQIKLIIVILNFYILLLFVVNLIN